MYSLVMMAAFTAGADATPAVTLAAAPAAVGCSGSYVLTSCGGCCGGYSTCSGCCGGCYGGGYGGGYGYASGHKWFGHRHGCVSYGCCGFNWGPYMGGGMGGYGGCCGYSYSCVGYGGCFGGCYGTAAYGSWSAGCGMLPAYGAFNIGGGGMYASPYAQPYTAPYMGSPTIGGTPVVVPPAGTPPAGVTAPAPSPIPPPITEPKKDAANIKFHLPANAKLYVDGRLTNGTGEDRPFYTPSLEPGRKFYYEAKAEMVINGETVVEEKRVIVKAGDDLSESFPKLLAAVAKKANVALAAK